MKPNWGIVGYCSQFSVIEFLDNRIFCKFLYTFVAFTFGFERSTYFVLESDGQVQFCITAGRGNGSEVYTVQVLSTSITTQGTVHNAVVYYSTSLKSLDAERYRYGSTKPYKN